MGLVYSLAFALSPLVLIFNPLNVSYRYRCAAPVGRRGVQQDLYGGELGDYRLHIRRLM